MDVLSRVACKSSKGFWKAAKSPNKGYNLRHFSPQLTINVNAARHFFHSAFLIHRLRLLTTGHPGVWWCPKLPSAVLVLSAANRAVWTAAEEDLRTTSQLTAQIATRWAALVFDITTMCTDCVPSAPTLVPKWTLTAAHRPRRSLSARTATLLIAVPPRLTLASLFLYLYLYPRYHVTFLAMATTIVVQYLLLARTLRPTMLST